MKLKISKKLKFSSLLSITFVQNRKHSKFVKSFNIYFIKTYRVQVFLKLIFSSVVAVKRIKLLSKLRKNTARKFLM